MIFKVNLPFPLFEMTFPFDTIPNILKELIASLFPYLFALAIISANITLLLGGITYLLDYNEKNGKQMIIRGALILILASLVFNSRIDENNLYTTLFIEINSFFSFISAYLLFIFSALSLILFIGNLGLYLLDSSNKRVRNIKKCGLCLLCAILPLGFQFPGIPKL